MGKRSVLQDNCRVQPIFMSKGTWEWHNLQYPYVKRPKNGLYTTETATIFSHQNVTYTNSAPRYTGQAPKLPVMMDIQNRI